MLLRVQSGFGDPPNRGEGIRYSKIIPKFKSCQKRKAMLLFAEIRRLKKRGKCKLGLDKLRFQVKRCLCITWKVAANEDLELNRDGLAGDRWSHGVSDE